MGCLSVAVAAAVASDPVLLLLLLSDMAEEEEGSAAADRADEALWGRRFWLKCRTKKLPAARAGPLAERRD